MTGLDLFAWIVLIVLVIIFTDRIKAAHVIRKVLLRQIAILNHVWPY